MSSRIFIKLMLAFLAVIAAATLTLDFTVRNAWENSLRVEIERSLVQKTRQLALRLGESPQQLSQIVTSSAQAAEARVTVIAADGTVLADSEADPKQMENHAQRPEFIAALKGEVGSNTRESHTLGIEFLYVAVPLKSGAVRLAYPLAAIRQLDARVNRTLLLASSVAILLALLLAGAASISVSRRLQRIVVFAERIAGGDLSARIAESSYDEIGRVAAALDDTARRVESAYAELRNSRENFETLLNSMEEPVIAFGPDRRLRWANRALQQVLEAPAQPGTLLVEALRDPELVRAAEAIATSGKTQQVYVANALPGRAFKGVVAPLPGGGGVVVLHDITEIERTEKTRRDFIANVSHELRTPLTSIRGYTETLLERSEGRDPELREFLETIHKNSERMSRLTEDLLTLARVESGEMRFEFHDLGARDVVQEAVSSFRAAAAEHGCSLEAEISSEAHVRADRDAMQQVLANLIENAIRYAGSGSRISVGARSGGGAVEFFVNDNGRGIPSEHLPHLFKRFYRVDRARSRESGGTGLGLAIVKHIVLAHGGEVRVESRLNHGATFVFTLPRAQALVPAAV